MSIAYSSGPIINATFTASGVTDITDNLKNQLVNANWSVVSGSSGDWIVQSATTPQSLSFRARIYDPGGGANCARINLRNTAGGITATTDSFLLPDASTWRIIANPYQFFIMKDSSPSASKRDFCAAGTGYIPSFLTVTECFWMSSASLSDISSASLRSFRIALTNDGANSNTGGYFTCINGNAFNAGTFESDIGTLRFRIGGGARFGTADILAGASQTFFDGTFFMDTPYLCWGISGSNVVATANCILYDAVLVEQHYAYGTTKTFDSHDWMAITNNNIGAAGNGLLQGTLFVRIT